MTQSPVERETRRPAPSPRRPRPDSAPPPQPAATRKNRDALAIACFTAAVLLLLAFLSYSPKDPALNTSTGSAPENWIRVVGSYSSDLLLVGFGYAAYVVPLLLCAYALVFFNGRSARFAWRQAFGFLALMLVLGSLLSLAFMPSASRPFLVQKGGIFGFFFASQLYALFGGIGGAVLLFGMLAIVVVLTWDVSLLGAILAIRAGIVEFRNWLARTAAERREKRAELREQAAAELEDLVEGPKIHETRSISKSELRGDTNEPDGLRAVEPIALPAENVQAEPVPARGRPTPFDELDEPEKPARTEPAPMPVLELEPSPAPAKPAAKPATGDPYVDSIADSLDDLAGLWGGPEDDDDEDDEHLPEALAAAATATQPKIKEKAEIQIGEQIEFQGFSGAYVPPSMDMLEHYLGRNIPVDRDNLIAQSQILVKKLEDFGVKGRVSDVHPGPIVTMYEFEPSPGIKINKIAALEDDLAMVLRAQSIRIIAPIPGKGAVGIEVPNRKRETIYMRELIESSAFQTHPSPLAVAFGKDITGHPVVEDLSKMPHLLVAGTTGSGKSVFINSIITSIIYKASPDDVRLVLIDPKMLELSDYADIPHLMCPVCTQPKKAAAILRWGVSEMENRYRIMQAMNVRNIANYNKKVEKLVAQSGKRRALPDDMPHHLPYIVIIIDELADLMMVAAKDLEESIARLAQMARAAGIHLLLATQRPSVDVVTGVIKANFPARVSFKVSSKVDSRTILDAHGAHVLLGNGDMLYLPPTESVLRRIHGCWISETEVQALVKFLKERNGTANFDRTVVEYIDERADDDSNGDDTFDGEIDPEFDRAVELIARERKASVSYIQRRLKIGYNRAARIVEQMEREGMVGPSDGTSRPRDVLIPPPRDD